MRTLTALLTTLLPILPLSASAQTTNGEVRLTLQEWLELERRIAALEAEAPAPLQVAFEARRLDARFDRGVLRGRLEVRVTAFTAPAEVPLVHTEASLSKVAVDGDKAVAVRRGTFYAVVLDAPGTHRIQVDLAVGEERARFARAFALAMPPAPISELRVDLPEQDLDVTIDGGVVLEHVEAGGRTLVTGAFDAREALSVTWRRRVVHTSARDREMEADARALIGLEDELVRTRTRVTYRMISGETDRIELSLPDGLEVTGVRGDAVLQWYTEPKRLVVLLKHLVTDEVSVLVESQAPLEDRTQAEISFPRPADASLREVLLAVEGRAGFAIEVARVEGGHEVGVREVPEALSELSNKPLLFAFEAEGAWPKLSLSIQRNAEIPLTQAVIDDLQASTVVTEQGVEVTKLRLYVRNNTRQYLELRLPENASITHALIDGVPFHPAAVGGEENGILIPLRQSERLEDGLRYHRVRAGETLGALSLRYLGTTDRWQAILDANQLAGPGDLTVGRTIEIPNEAAGVKFEESNFVVELAYKRRVPALGLFGRHVAGLPVLDIPAMAATWHVYLPDAHEALHFESNLTQLTAIRYDPLRRIRWFIEEAMRVEHAWAGMPQADSYENILSSRKRIYKEEQRRQVTEALSSFPLVGRRYRFERVLLGDEQAKVEVTYLDRSVTPFLRWAAFLLALFLSFRLARVLRTGGAAQMIRSSAFVAALVGLGCLLFVGYHVLGVHRFTLHGIDAGLALAILPAILRGRVRGLSEKVRTGLSFETAFRGRTILKLFLAGLALTMALTYPLLLSSILFVVLMIFAVRTREVAHA